MANSEQTPWKDGYYKSSTRSTSLFKVMGESVEMETLQGKMDEQLSKGKRKFGEFGEAHPDLIKHTGKSNYNVEMNMMNGLWIRKGILSDDGLTISLWTKDLELFEWISEEEYISLKNSGDPAEAHFGRDKVCMRQRVGCATCAKVSWIDKCFPCFLFQDCPDALRPRSKKIMQIIHKPRQHRRKRPTKMCLLQNSAEEDC